MVRERALTGTVEHYIITGSQVDQSKTGTSVIQKDSSFFNLNR